MRGAGYVRSHAARELRMYYRKTLGRAAVHGRRNPITSLVSDGLIATCTTCNQLLVHGGTSLSTDLPKLRRGPCKTGCGYAHSIPSGAPKCCRHCPRAFMMEISDECVLATVADPCD